VIQLLLRRAGCGHKGNAYARAGPVGVCCGLLLCVRSVCSVEVFDGCVHIPILIVCYVEVRRSFCDLDSTIKSASPPVLPRFMPENTHATKLLASTGQLRYEVTDSHSFQYRTLQYVLWTTK
jgi:hypothetical protein